MSQDSHDFVAPVPRVVRLATKEDGTRRHPGIVSLLTALEQSHLNENTEPSPNFVSAPVLGLAYRMCELLPDGPEVTAGLRKLLEAEDCFLRAQREIK